MEQNYNAIDKAFEKLENELKEKEVNELSYHTMQRTLYGTGQFILREEGKSDKRN
jgi:hypothetical protein